MSKNDESRYKAGVVIEGALGFAVKRHGMGRAEILKLEDRDIVSLLNADPVFVDGIDEIENDILRIANIPSQYWVKPADCESLLDEKLRREEIKVLRARADNCKEENRKEYLRQLQEKENGNLLEIETISDSELVGLINQQRLLEFVEKYGIPLESGFSYRSEDTPISDGIINRSLIQVESYGSRIFNSVIGFDYIRLCGRTLLYYSFAEVIRAIETYGITDQRTMCAFAFFVGTRIRIDAMKPQQIGAASSIISDAYAKNSRGFYTRTSRLSWQVWLAFASDMRSIGFDFSIGENRPVTLAKDYFSYFAYALLVKWNAVMDGKPSRGTYKKCEGTNCGNLFWADRSNRKYCNTCDRRREYAQKETAKEKRREKTRAARTSTEKEGVQIG